MPDDASNNLSDEERGRLLEVARQAISHELYQYVSLKVDTAAFSPSLNRPGAAFVTLKIEGRLRGCIGSLEPRRPLVLDVARNAGAAAFNDPRFPRLGRDEFERIEIEISILSPATPIAFTSEEDLIRQLRPGMDGLILIEGTHRGTFLPSVWEQIPGPAEFLQHLKKKAALPADYWSDTIEVLRYTTESFP